MYLEVVQYENKIKQLLEFISNGPYKLEYILTKLKISRSTFYNKRKTNNFTLEEVKVLAKMYDDVDATTRLEAAIQEGLDDIANGRVYELDDVLKEVRQKYGLQNKNI